MAEAGFREIKNLEYEINYETCLKNNFRGDVQGAVKFYLGLSDTRNFSGGTDDPLQHNMIDDGFVLYPQALNPFLRIMETLKEARNIVILPSFNNDGFKSPDDINAPAYLIIKIGRSGFVRKLIASSI